MDIKEPIRELTTIAMVMEVEGDVQAGGAFQYLGVVVFLVEVVVLEDA